MNELSEIINGGYCIGCGACASISSKHVKIVEDKYQKYVALVEPTADQKSLSDALNVCPFSNSGLNEDELSRNVFDQSKGKVGDVIGYYRSLYAGHVTEDDMRSKTTSGGIITWVLSQLLERKMVDAVIHVKESQKGGTLFEYTISRTTIEVLAGAKSRYYPIEISEVLDFVKRTEGKYVFVGLPCFVKAIRKYSMCDSVVAERIKYCIGLVCGHLKSKAFAEFVGWKSGIEPGKLAYIDFRYKLPDRPANDYGIYLRDTAGNSKVVATHDIPEANWGLGYFKYEACDYCDDIFSETADLAVGDAWLNHYTADSKGNSVIITRNGDIDLIISEGIQSGSLKLDNLSENEIRKSQGGGFRHRRSGLGYRLYLKQKRGEWAPNKRVSINPNGLSKSRKLIYKLRVYLREKSLEYWTQAKNDGNYKAFQQRMNGPTKVYYFLLKISAFMNKLKR